MSSDGASVTRYYL